MDTQELRDELRDLELARKQETLEASLESRPVRLEIIRYVETRKKEVQELLELSEKSDDSAKLWKEILTRYGIRHGYKSPRATEEAMEKAGWREKFEYLWNNGTDTLEEMEQLLFYK